MKKLFTLLSLALVALAVQAQELTPQDFTGKFVLTQIEGVDDPNSFLKSDCLGHELNITINNYWGDTPNELRVDNIVPATSTNACYGYISPADKSGYLYSKRSTSFSGYRVATYAEEGEDLDIDAADYVNNISVGTPDGFKDLVLNYSDDLETITVECLALISKNNASAEPALKIAKMVYERAQIPSAPSISTKFNLATGYNDVTIVLPTTMESGKNIDAISKVVLQRNHNWNGYEEVKTWENCEPGATIVYEDQDLDFNNPYYQYQVYIYVGFNSSSDYTGGNIGQDAPRVNNLELSSNNGQAPITITFTLPSEEELLIPLEKVEILRGISEGWWTYTEPIATLTEDLTAGRLVTYTDNEVTEGNKYLYEVKTYWKYGTSPVESASIFVGLDRPSAPVNVQASSVNGKVTLTWEAPTTGRKGGDIDPAKTTYAIERIIGGGWEGDVLAIGFTETSFEDNLDLTDPTKVRYYVYASDDFETDEEPAYQYIDIVVGSAYSLPFVETFDKPGDWDGYFGTDKMWEGNFDLWGNVSFGFDFNINKETLGSGFYYLNKGAWDWNIPYSEEFTSFAIDFSNATCPVTLLTMVALPDDCTGYVEVKSGDKSFGKVSPFNLLTDQYWESKVYAVPMPELAGNPAGTVTFKVATGDVAYEKNIIVIDKIEIAEYETARDIKVKYNGTGYDLTWTTPDIDGIWDEMQLYRAVVTGDEEPQFEVIAKELYEGKYTDNTNFESDCTVYYMVKTIYSDPYYVEAPSAIAGAAGITTSINSAAATTGTKYYNTQGMRVDRPAKGNVYIKVVDGKASKVVF